MDYKLKGLLLNVYINLFFKLSQIDKVSQCML